MEIFRIGLDFDGVIANTPALKSIAAKETIGVDIPPEEMLAKNVIEKNFLTMDEYHALQQEVYFEHPQWHEQLKPMPDAQKSIQHLLEDGHTLFCITSRTPEAVSLARQWIEREGIPIEIYDMSGHPSKTSVVKDLDVDVFIDDDPQYLEPMVGVVEHLFLFSWSYNQAYDEGERIKRTGSWSDILSRIKKISKS